METIKKKIQTEEMITSSNEDERSRNSSVRRDYGNQGRGQYDARRGASRNDQRNNGGGRMDGTRSGTGVSRFDQRIKEADVWMVLGAEQG